MVLEYKFDSKKTILYLLQTVSLFEGVYKLTCIGIPKHKYIVQQNTTGWFSKINKFCVRTPWIRWYK